MWKLLLTLGLSQNGSVIDLSHPERYVGYSHYQLTYKGEDYSADVVHIGYPVLRGKNFSMCASLYTGIEQHYETEYYNKLYHVSFVSIDFQVKTDLLALKAPTAIFASIQPGKYFDTMSTDNVGSQSGYRNQASTVIGLQFILQSQKGRRK